MLFDVSSNRNSYGSDRQMTVHINSSDDSEDSGNLDDVSLEETEVQQEALKIHSELEKDFEEEKIYYNKLWNRCILCDQPEYTDERDRTVCCGKSIDDRKFFYPGMAIASTGAFGSLVGTVCNNLPTMCIGTITILAGVAFAYVPATKSCYVGSQSDFESDDDISSD